MFALSFPAIFNSLTPFFWKGKGFCFLGLTSAFPVTSSELRRGRCVGYMLSQGNFGETLSLPEKKKKNLTFKVCFAVLVTVWEIVSVAHLSFCLFCNGSALFKLWVFKKYFMSIHSDWCLWDPVACQAGCTEVKSWNKLDLKEESEK